MLTFCLTLGQPDMCTYMQWLTTCYCTFVAMLCAHAIYPHDNKQLSLPI